MDAEQRNELAALERAVAFLGSAAPRIPRIINSQVCEDFVSRVADIRKTASEQLDRRAGGRGSTARKRDLRHAIVRDHIAPIVAVGAAYNLTYFSVIVMPGTRSRDHEFIEECRGVLTAAEHHRDELERLGLGAGFCDAFRATVEELGDTQFETCAGGSRRSGVGLRLRAELRHAWALVRAVSRMIAAEPNLAATDVHEWRAALLHASRPAHRLAAARKLLALPPAPSATPSTPTEPAPSSSGTSLALRAPAAIAAAVGAAAPRRIARIFARVRLLLPTGDQAA